MSARSCRSCDYFDPGTSHQGLCRFNAPTAVVTEDATVMTHWPIVRYADWCGKWTISTGPPPPMAKPPLWRRTLDYLSA